MFSHPGTNAGKANIGVYLAYFAASSFSMILSRRSFSKPKKTINSALELELESIKREKGGIFLKPLNSEVRSNSLLNTLSSFFIVYFCGSA